jgi:hypothetical protein
MRLYEMTIRRWMIVVALGAVLISAERARRQWALDRERSALRAAKAALEEEHRRHVLERRDATARLSELKARSMDASEWTVRSPAANNRRPPASIKPIK